MDGVVGPAGVLESLDLRFSGACVERRVRFGPSDGVVVVMGNDTDNSSHATGSVTGGGGLSRTWGGQDV